MALDPPPMFETTGEERKPEEGEYFMSPTTGHIVRLSSYTEQPDSAIILRLKDVWRRYYYGR